MKSKIEIINGKIWSQKQTLSRTEDELEIYE